MLEPGEPVPDFAMTTQDGKTLRLSDLRGKVVVLTFIYTRCPLPDFCPLMDGKFAELARTVAAVPGRAEQVRLLSVSFDPEHDTPEVLAKHAKLRGAKPPLWTFAVASHEELRKVAAPLGLTYGPREGRDHPQPHDRGHRPRRPAGPAIRRVVVDARGRAQDGPRSLLAIDGTASQTSDDAIMPCDGVIRRGGNDHSSV